MAEKASKVPPGVRNANTIGEALAEVLRAIHQNEQHFPERVSRTRINISLATGDRLELEIDGAPHAPSLPPSKERFDPCHIERPTLAAAAAFKSIDDLGLSASAKASAEKLLAQFPSEVRYTSGRRTIEEQALAMAANVAQNRNWIEETYKDSRQRADLQDWVDANPAATDVSDIAAGLEGVMRSWTEAQLRSFSRHMTGDAFDVQPVSGAVGVKIKEAIAKLPKLSWYTFNEGGLEIWHAQFDV